MQQHELNGNTLLPVEAPPQDEIQSIVWDIARLQIFKKGGELVAKRPMPPGNWKFFAFTDTIKEEQAAELVESLEGDLGDYANSQHRGYIVKFYKDYNHTGKLSNWLPTAKKSFQSWLFANGISGNNAILIKQ